MSKTISRTIQIRTPETSSIQCLSPMAESYIRAEPDLDCPLPRDGTGVALTSYHSTMSVISEPELISYLGLTFLLVARLAAIAYRNLSSISSLSLAAFRRSPFSFHSIIPTTSAMINNGMPTVTPVIAMSVISFVFAIHFAFGLSVVAGLCAYEVTTIVSVRTEGLQLVVLGVSSFAITSPLGSEKFAVTQVEGSQDHLSGKHDESCAPPLGLTACNWHQSSPSH